AHSSVWCGGDGPVVRDGVGLRQAPAYFPLTAAPPSLGYFTDLARGYAIEISDASTTLAGLALQGPRSGRILASLCPDVRTLPYFGVTTGDLAGAAVTISLTGFTGDLGYEVWAGADEALTVWDAVAEAAVGHDLVPVGQQAVLMTRIEAGLILIDVDYRPSRFAWP